MDGMEEVRERKFRRSNRSMASGELGRRRRASRELKWVGAYSEARVRRLQVPNARRSSCSLGD